MKPGPTEEYVMKLMHLKTGDLGLLRTHIGQALDESVDGFDLFTGLWWPLREKNLRAPRRSVAWLVAKLYAFCPLAQSTGDTLARQLRKCQPKEPRDRERYRRRFDELLSLSLEELEPALQWALQQIASRNARLDWAKLTDDLSIWEREKVRLEWAEEFITIEERTPSC